MFSVWVFVGFSVLRLSYVYEQGYPVNKDTRHVHVPVDMSKRQSFTAILTGSSLCLEHVFTSAQIVWYFASRACSKAVTGLPVQYFASRACSKAVTGLPVQYFASRACSKAVTGLPVQVTGLQYECLHEMMLRDSTAALGKPTKSQTLCVHSVKTGLHNF